MTTEPTPDPGIAAYGRLSRADERDKATPLAEKVYLRKEILKTLAKQEAGAQLVEEQIVFELKSAASLDERPGLLALLDRCRRRELHTLVLFDIDRLTRDTGDWKTIERALFKGQVRLVTARGTYHFTPQFDPTMLQILAVLGEKELRSFSFRRKATNVQRARAGQRSAGQAPYGYVWLSDRKCYVIQEEEYRTVCWIFENALTMSTGKLADELNALRIPPPSAGKRADAATQWRDGTVLAILRNPLYTGRPAKRTEVDREGASVQLSVDQWIWAEQDLLTPIEGEDVETTWAPLPHPVTRPQWDLLQETITGRRVARQIDGPGLLNRLLHCSAGAAMYLNGRGYHCECREAGKGHPAMSVTQTVERYVLAALAAHLDTLPDLPPPPKRKEESGTGDRRIEAAQTRRQLREKEATRLDLIQRASWYQSLPGYGVAGHTATVEALSGEIEALRARLVDLEALVNRPEAGEAVALIRQIQQAGGFAALLAEASPEVRYQVVRTLVERITLDAPPGKGKHTRSAQMTLPAIEGLEEKAIRIHIPGTSENRPRGVEHWTNRRKQAAEAG